MKKHQVFSAEKSQTWGSMLLFILLMNFTGACENKPVSMTEMRKNVSEKKLNADSVTVDTEGTSGQILSSIKPTGTANSPVPGENPEEGSTGSETIKVETFNREFDFAGSVFQPQVWVVTSGNKIFRFKIDKEKTYPRTDWTIPSTLGGGNRTYVTEVGLLVGKTASGGNGAEIWLANEAFGSEAKLIDQVPDALNGTRVCVTSFKKDREPYIGYIYTEKVNSKVKFVEIPIDITKDLKVDVSRKVSFTSTTGGNVAYSCFVDQKNNRFWAGQEIILGVNLNNGEFLQSESLPNFGWQLSIAGSESKYTGKLNYAIAGDADGNLLNAKIGGVYTYTMTHEHLTKKVFTTTRSTALIVTDVDCFSTNQNCNDKSITFTNLPESSGPISSLNDGRVAILSRRGADSSLMLASLKDNNKPESGLVVEKIADIPGDPYMYTDFTGGTMYAPTVEQTFAMREGNGLFVKNKKSDLTITWESASTVPEDQMWRGIKVLIRCYKEDITEKPEYDRVLPVANSGVATKVNVPDCLTGNFDHIDLKLEAEEGTSVFTKSKKMVLKVFQ